MAHAIFSDMTASVTELKRDPMGTASAGDGAPVAILNRNEPAFYCVPADMFADMMERLEDAELNAIADTRTDEPAVSVALDDL